MSFDLYTWKIERQYLREILLIAPPRFSDDRGWFMETFNKSVFAEHGIEIDFVQDNMSFSRSVGTVRGLHYQSPPYAQAKLVRVVQGRILDVAVDIRRDSPTYGHHLAVELSADDRSQLLVPIGFAHGFVTREPDTMVSYKVSNFYSPDHDHNILWSDEEINIDWGISVPDAIVSEKDACAPPLHKATPLL